jgi:hypothetical protein
MAKKEIPENTWRITLISGKRGHVYGRVSAPEADEAIKRAIEEYKITNPEHQKRLVAQRVA